jgi:hypothetical protein
VTFTAPTPTVTRTADWLGAEPNWTLLGQEWGGLPNPHYDSLVRVYCDLATRSTFAVTVSDGLAGWVADEDRDEYSWAGYEWAADGQVWQLRGGAEPDHQWWVIDDLLWGGFGLDSVRCVVDADTHTVISREEIARRCFESGLLAPAAVAREAIELWWGPVTPAEEVRLGLTTAEVDEGIQQVQDLLSNL